MNRRASILVATYQGYPGDTETPFLTPILTRLVGRGHTLRIMFGSGVRQTRLSVSERLMRQLADIGTTIVPFRPPESHPFDNPPPPRGLLGRWIPRQFRGIPRQTQTLLWAPAWAANVAAELRRMPADMVLADFVLLGALAAAEAARVPCVAPTGDHRLTCASSARQLPIPEHPHGRHHGRRRWKSKCWRVDHSGSQPTT
jgi:hypothetical protein